MARRPGRPAHRGDAPQPGWLLHASGWYEHKRDGIRLELLLWSPYNNNKIVIKDFHYVDLKALGAALINLTTPLWGRYYQLHFCQTINPAQSSEMVCPKCAGSVPLACDVVLFAHSHPSWWGCGYHIPQEVANIVMAFWWTLYDWRIVHIRTLLTHNGPISPISSAVNEESKISH